MSKKKKPSLVTISPILSTFSKEMILHRKRKGISQERLAKMLNIHRITINYYEKNKMLPSLNNTIKIAIALDMSLDEIIKKYRNECKIEFQNNIKKCNKLNIEELKKEVKEENYKSFSKKAENNAQKVLDFIHKKLEKLDYKTDIFPTKDQEIAIDIYTKWNKISILVLCSSTGNIACFYPKKGKNSYFRHNNINNFLLSLKNVL